MTEAVALRALVQPLVAGPFAVGQLARLSPGLGAGWPASSDETLWFLTPILGPSSTLALHRLSASALLGVQTWSIGDLGSALGLIPHKATEALVRLALFGFAEVVDGEYQVATWVPPLPSAWRRRLPGYLLGFYDERVAAA